jgi:hypothetical protein
MLSYRVSALWPPKAQLKVYEWEEGPLPFPTMDPFTRRVVLPARSDTILAYYHQAGRDCCVSWRCRSGMVCA